MDGFRYFLPFKEASISFQKSMKFMGNYTQIILIYKVNTVLFEKKFKGSECYKLQLFKNHRANILVCK